MSPGLRKLVLTAHVTTSVGWLGSVAAFFALGIATLARSESAGYVAMNVIGAWVIVPLCFGALVSGLVQSLGTQWGLVKHYWVLVKFVLALGATTLLVLHQFTAVSEAARRASAGLPVGRLGVQLAGDSALAVMVLLVATTLSIYKPWGKTRYADPDAPPMPTGVKIVAYVTAGVALLAFVAMHLTGMHAH